MSKIKPFIPSSFDEKNNNLKRDNSYDEDDERIAQKINELSKSAHEKGFNEGYKEGFKKGKEDALKKGEEEIHEKIEKLNIAIEIFKKLTEELTNFKEKQLEFFLPQIMKLAFKISEKIVATKITLDREVTLEILKEALSAVPIHEEKILVKLNPEDYELISNKIDELKLSKTKIRLEPLKKLKRGELEIETESFHIVSTLEQKLEEIENALNTIISKQS